MKLLLGFTFALLAIAAQAQYTQKLKGTIVDHVLQKPLAGATVTIKSLNRSVVTNDDGVFRFKDLPIGSYQLTITYSGFKEAILENIVINTGKETELTIPLEPLVRVENEITLKANSKKNKPLNDMSAVSARAFTVEETQRYAAAVNDPLRMAAAFPGVMAADDGNNNIIIRGNSPGGLLWKMEGMDIPNPNHFSSAGTSGGGISILSSQLLSNSDFVTAAFAAEYGNALSGVFDLKLRKGNNEKKEYTLQAGVLGLNAAIEGPISAFYKGSYLVNYRYSTLSLLNKIGVLSDDGTTNFQDLSYNIYLPAGKAGAFTLFGFGGLSNQQVKEDKDSLHWEEKDDRYPSKYISNTGMSGITHTILAGKNTSIKSGVGISYTKNSYDERFIEDDYTVNRTYKDRFTTRKWLFNSTINHRFGRKLTMRAGVIGSLIRYNFYQESADHEGDPLEVNVDTKGSTSTQQAFAQWQFKPGNNLAINAGLHYLHLSLNNKSAVEPRFSIKWTIDKRSNLSAGYGQHSQLQSLGTYFTQTTTAGGETLYPNKNLDFTRAHHYVLSYSYRVATNLLLKAEAYYQQLYKVPVSPDAGSTFSPINIDDDYVWEPLTSKGKGRNYGIEISAERYLHNNFYLTLSNSFYQSKYTAIDGIERNTRYNGNYIITLISGKDFVSERKRRTYGINIKTIYAGGLRTTPIDLEASQQLGYTVLKEDQAYSLQNPAYFRADLRVSVKWNRKRLTSTLSLDIQNLTNRLNVYNQRYDSDEFKLVTSYQTGLIPILNYKVEF